MQIDIKSNQFYYLWSIFQMFGNLIDKNNAQFFCFFSLIDNFKTHENPSRLPGLCLWALTGMGLGPSFKTMLGPSKKSMGMCWDLAGPRPKPKPITIWCYLWILFFHYRFGVCCLFITSTSGSTSSQNCSYIQNPNYPNAYGSTTAISFTVAKCSSGMFLEFTKL